MKITAIRLQTKNPNRVSIYLDGEFFCGLSLDQLLDLGLSVQQEITVKQSKDIKRQSDLGKLYLRALEWSLLRPRSTKELDDYLFRKKIDGSGAEYIKNKLKQYINDTEFVEFWVNGRRSSKLKSSRAIRAELRAKGINNNMIDQALANHELQDLDVLPKLISKKQRLAKYKDRQKLTQYLLRQGFNYSDVSEVLAG